MSRVERPSKPNRQHVVAALVGGVAVYAASILLELFEPAEAVFFSFVFGLPVVVGLILGARGWRPIAAAAPFVVAYLIISVHDWIATGGDVLFHFVLALLTGGLAAGAAAAARASTRR